MDYQINEQNLPECARTSKKAALLAALPLTLPVFTGYIVLGAAYGILMDSKGFSLFWIYWPVSLSMPVPCSLSV
jgi:predicted branched-subunit amino acid permease